MAAVPVVTTLTVLDINSAAPIVGATVVYTLAGATSSTTGSTNGSGVSTESLLPGAYRVVITPANAAYHAVVVNCVVGADIQPNLVNLKKAKTPLLVVLYDKGSNAAIAGCTVTVDQGLNGALIGTTDSQGLVSFALSASAIDPDVALTVTTGLIGAFQPVAVTVIPNQCLVGAVSRVALGLS